MMKTDQQNIFNSYPLFLGYVKISYSAFSIQEIKGKFLLTLWKGVSNTGEIKMRLILFFVLLFKWHLKRAPSNSWMTDCSLQEKIFNPSFPLKAAPHLKGPHIIFRGANFLEKRLPASTGATPGIVTPPPHTHRNAYYLLFCYSNGTCPLKTSPQSSSPDAPCKCSHQSRGRRARFGSTHRWAGQCTHRAERELRCLLVAGEKKAGEETDEVTSIWFFLPPGRTFLRPEPPPPPRVWGEVGVERNIVASVRKTEEPL